MVCITGVLLRFHSLSLQQSQTPVSYTHLIKGTPLGNADISQLTTEYCMKVLCLARLLVPKADIRCAAGREVYFKGEEKKLLSVVDSIFASGYLTEGGQGIEDTLKKMCIRDSFYAFYYRNCHHMR